ncbi:DUF4222 domain-containing protein [Escherichia coli]|uniref:DUF4222 domain-containing protein n=1 Tax=Escherichia coli TaxID=562 RepID=UPI002806B5EA|nr:DUF4222 domain-containing protein [Escherichia coli]MDQ8059941.1 DUF4222 domain-containing protein [Escherichia coli]
MKKKNSGFTASGPARPEIRPGDIFRDNYGGTVTIKSVAGRCVTYRRDGYGYDCVMPVDAPRDKCTLSCAINGIHAAFHYLKKNYISGCVMTVPTG